MIRIPQRSNGCMDLNFTIIKRPLLFLGIVAGGLVWLLHTCPSIFLPSFDPITLLKNDQSRHFSLWILRAFRLQSVPALQLQQHHSDRHWPLTIQTPVLMVLIMIWIGDDGKIILQSFVSWWHGLISHYLDSIFLFKIVMEEN